MPRYIAFDVETPNRLNDKMSSIGITVIENGAVKDHFYSLVNPETHFDYFNTQLTGIDAKAVSRAPTFSKLWREIEPLMSSGVLVAHNAVFDMGVLKKCLNGYGISWKDSAKYLCTVQIGRRVLPGISHKLNDLSERFGISLNHHNAASDSEACARILLKYIESGTDVNSFIKTYYLRA